MSGLLSQELMQLQLVKAVAQAELGLLSEASKGAKELAGESLPMPPSCNIPRALLSFGRKLACHQSCPLSFCWYTVRSSRCCDFTMAVQLSCGTSAGAPCIAGTPFSPHMGL